MGTSYSKPEKIYRAARGNDLQALQGLLREAGRTPGLLEWRDPQGFTPLLAAAAKGNNQSVDLLIRAGANLSALNDKPYLSSALHEAAQHSHVKVVETLLAAGANPFEENGRGLTAVDIAINQRNVGIIRRLESRSPFAGYLNLKVPRYLGLSTEWKTRWCVIMPRYPNHSPSLAAGDRVVRSLLVVYKAADEVQPLCKAWLDGAVARSVLGSKGSNQLQCALSLHRSHAPPGGAHVTGDPQAGYTLHLRPAQASQEHTSALRRFMELCNMGAGGLMNGGTPTHQRNNSAPAGQQWSPGPSPSGTPTWSQHARIPSQVPPVPSHVAAGVGPSSSSQAGPSQPYPSNKAANLGPVIADPGMTDEQMARRLQQAFDQEAAQYLIEHPNQAAMPHMAQRMFSHPSEAASSSPGPSGVSGAMYPAINHTGAGRQPASPGPLQASAGGSGGGVHMHSNSDVASAFPQSAGARLQPQASAPPIPPQGQSDTYQQPNAAQASSQGGGTVPSSNSLQSAVQWWSQLPSAGTPPASAFAGASPPESAPAIGGDSAAPTARMEVGRPGTTSGKASSADDDALCVVCLEEPASAGFVHGDSVHKCCCRNCATELKQAQYPSCPMCRQRIEHIILNFY